MAADAKWKNIEVEPIFKFVSKFIFQFLVPKNRLWMHNIICKTDFKFSNFEELLVILFVNVR